MKEYKLENFLKTNWTFVLTRNDKIIYRSKKEGLQPLVFCLKYQKDALRGAIVFDKIIGRAAALLLISGKIKKVITPIITKDAFGLLQKNKIAIEYRKLVTNILNQTGTGLCPMEKLSKGKSAEEFLKIILS